MAGGQNLAEKYLSQVDERWTTYSQAELVLGGKWDFTGDKVVRVYSIPVAPMNDYARSGSNRFGTANDLSRNVQTMTVSKDRAFTFVIDEGDKVQSQMVMDAGAALARQISEVVVPEFDTYVFGKLFDAAKANGAYASTAITSSNAYEMFLNGVEYLGDHNVPMEGLVGLVSYNFYNKVLLDTHFVKAGDRSQEMVIKGLVGELDGVPIARVANTKLPAGCEFIIAHKEAAVGPKQLETFRIQDNPVGINGWVVEGRTIYDCFILNEKACGVYAHGGAQRLKALNVMTSAASSTTYDLLVNGTLEGSKWYYQAKTSAAGFDSLTFGSAITTGNFTEMKDASNNPINHVEGLTKSTNTVVRVVEVDAANKPIAFGDAVINVSLN